MNLTKIAFDPKFKFEVTALPGGELVKRCLDCGSCAGACPVSESGIGFDPRKILHMIKLGLKIKLLSSNNIWYCTHCDACGFICPQEIQFSSVIDVVREIAIKEGYADSTSFEAWGTAPCKATCPAHISISGFVTAISEGRYREGLQIIKEEMPFPAACGRVCPHPCEARCNRGSIDEPVAIESLKRFLADRDLFSDIPYVPMKKTDKNEEVAVIGAGPAGLTVAYYLAIEGYRVTVFERLPVPGGMMAVGIPEFRLPKSILQAEIDIVRKLGVDIRLNVEIGRDTTFVELQKTYRAVFIGVGCHRSLMLRVPGEEELTNVIPGLTFLRDANLGNFPTKRGRLVVIGGGNTAIDCARVAIRLGYSSVAILYRRTREEMPAYPWEVEEAIDEGVDIHFLTAPVRIRGEEGRVSGLDCIRMNLGEPDESGRRRPLPIHGSEFTEEADSVVMAVGQGSESGYLSCLNGLSLSKKGLVKTDPLTGATNIPGIFAGGDVATGPQTVVAAIASGKAAARSIGHYLRGEPIKTGSCKKWEGLPFTARVTELAERETMQVVPTAERKRTFREMNLGFTEKQAKREAGRCFRICGIQKSDAM